MSKSLKPLFILLFLLISISFSSCINTVSLYRNYAGENENYKISIRSQLEYNGRSAVPKQLAYDNENLYAVIRMKVIYTGTKSIENLKIIKIEMVTKYENTSISVSNNDTLSLFNEKNIYFKEYHSSYLVMNRDTYYVQFTYSDGTMERIDAKLTDSKGELKDLDLVIPEYNSQN